MDEDTRAVYEEILRVARSRGITYYSDVAPKAGLNMDSPADRKHISRILGDISTTEHKGGRPLLSAVVILRERNIPGKGFFSLAQELGLYHGGNDVQYWTQELQRVYDWHGAS